MEAEAEGEGESDPGERYLLCGEGRRHAPPPSSAWTIRFGLGIPDRQPRFPLSLF